MQTTKRLLIGAMTLCLLPLLSGCGPSKPVKRESSISVPKLVIAPELRYVPIDPEAVRDSDPPAYGSGPLTNGHIEARMLALELHASFQRAQLAAVRCLAGAKPETPAAAQCIQALDAIRNGRSP